MVKVEKSKSRTYLERAKDCFNSIKALQVIYYDNDVKPDYLKDYSLNHFDVFFMLYSIAVISLVNCMTIKLFGEKGKDHKDLSFYRRLKGVLPEISRFDKIVFDINNVKNASEYGDKHISKKEIVDIKALGKFIEFVERNT